MTDYPRDFYSPPEAAGFAPEPPGGLEAGGFDPGAGLWLALALVAVAGLAFLIGWLAALRRREAEADRLAADLHGDVLKAAEAALGARSTEMVSRAEALKTVLDDRLGPLLVLGAGLTASVKALDRALEGRAEDDHGKDHNKGHGPDHDKGHDKGHEKGHGGSHAGPGCGCGCGGEAPCGGVTVQQIVIGAPSAGRGCRPAAATPPGPAKEAGHGHEDKRLTAAEQIEALSKAVRAFHDHWSQSGRRIAELRAARRALERRTGLIAAATPAKTDGKRIWDR